MERFREFEKEYKTKKFSDNALSNPILVNGTSSITINNISRL